MLCRSPYIAGVIPCGCGQCIPCRINKRRLWSNRMHLESVKHAGNSFVTLTYETAPAGDSLNPGHAQLWLKRLRKALYPEKIRFFLVGEYGEQTQRPHYHAAIFGLDPVVGGGDDGRSGVVKETWGMGHTFTGDLTPESASYVAGYVTKKMTSAKDPRLHGRYPEFARMSLRPGLGAHAMQEVSEVLKTEYGQTIYEKTGDLPTALRQGRKSLYLGRYLRSVLTRFMGGLCGLQKETPEMLLMRLEFEEKNQALPLSMRWRGRNYWDAFSRYMAEVTEQRAANMVSQFKTKTAKGYL